MILSFIALTSVLLAVPSAGAMDKDEFQDYLDQICFGLDITTGEPLVNGQVNPLAQTLENFIALAEKYEAANPHVGLKDELFYFVRNYTYDNFEFSKIGDRKVWVPAEADTKEVNELWEPDYNQRRRLPDGQDPFTDGEKCSLFYTLSHSIIREPRVVNKERAPAYNRTRNSVMKTFVLDEQYPMETGVVSIKGTNVGVALGKVLLGMYVGLNQDRKRPIGDIKEIKNIESIQGLAPQVDPLYTVTIAEAVAMASWRPEAELREKLATDGHWVSKPIGNDLDTKDICPMIYKLNENTQAAYSHSSFRGAADGFILGRIVGALERRNRQTKVSQILRMYYSRGGISERDEELGAVWVSFCNRQSIIYPLEQTLNQQVLMYELLVGGLKLAKENTEFAWKYYNEQKNEIFGYRQGGIKDYCGKALTVERPEDLPLESPLDIIAVIDTSDGEENVKRQQMILGYLAKELDLSHGGSRMTVLTDQKAGTDADGKITLTSIVTDSESASCVACTVTQFDPDNSPSAPEDEVIFAIDHLLKEKSENETKYQGVNGKVVIYFNFKEDDFNGKQSSLQRRIDAALSELHLRHQEVVFYALGKATEFVKKYAKNDMAFVMSAVDEAENIVGKKLFEKISTAPATLQYNGCEDGKGENGAIYEDFVSQNAIQHWGMPAKYFLKSRELKFIFESQYGPVRVCHNRATVNSELQKESCHDVTNGQKYEYKDRNPCKGFSVHSCSPYYFSIIGINSSATDASRQEFCSDTNTDKRCRTLDQVKFKVSHEGIRCNGSVGLVATPVLLVLAITLINLLSKKY